MCLVYILTKTKTIFVMNDVCKYMNNEVGAMKFELFLEQVVKFEWHGMALMTDGRSLVDVTHQFDCNRHLLE